MSFKFTNIFQIESAWKTRTVLTTDAIGASSDPMGSLLQIGCALAAASTAVHSSHQPSSLEGCPGTIVTALACVSPPEQPVAD